MYRFSVEKTLQKLAVLLCLVAGYCQASSATWSKLTTPDFELYTTANQKQALQVLEKFERTRLFFLQAVPQEQRPQFPVRVIAFRSRAEYQPYSSNGLAFSYYLGSQNRDYIVLQDLEPEHQQVAIHEYAHFVIRQLNGHLPVWLDEGIADLFSTLQESNGKIVVGRPLDSRLNTLKDGNLLSLTQLFSVDRQSHSYNSSAHLAMIYAESWALTHMLRLSPAYRAGFNDVLAGLAQGKSTARVLEEVYQKPVAAIEADLKNYVSEKHWPSVSYPYPAEDFKAAIKVEPAETVTVQIALGDLLASLQRFPQAETILNAVVAQDAQRGDVDEALGYLAWRKGDTLEAQRHFARAVNEGSRNARMMLHFARLSVALGLPEESVVPYLKQAVLLQPNYRDARLALGLILTRTGRYEEALAQLHQISPGDPAQDSTYFAALALAEAKVHKVSTVAAPNEISRNRIPEAE